MYVIPSTLLILEVSNRYKLAEDNTLELELEVELDTDGNVPRFSYSDIL